MTRRTSLTMALILAGGVAHGSDFCDGYEEGYAAAWYDAPLVIRPMPQPCPQPSGPEYDSYEGGYAEGFNDGRADREATGK